MGLCGELKNWDPLQWRPQDRPPGRSRSRCIWSCRCHSASSADSRQRESPPL
uniref:Uncharacterized protein n=1 Tax=Anguilla anguilla TaxID=7936 RepID=A0A0E9QUX5_ANGAN